MALVFCNVFDSFGMLEEQCVVLHLQKWIFTFCFTICLGPKKQVFFAKTNWGQMKLPNFLSSSSDSLLKLGHDFSNKVVQKLKLSINHFYQTDSDDFWQIKIQVEVKNRHFLTSCLKMETKNLVISFDYCWFLLKTLFFRTQTAC